MDSPDQVSRAAQEYLDTLDDAAFGGSTPVQPKSISKADPAARYTGANGDRPFFAYSTNYLVDLDNAVIVDVDATAPIRQAEVQITKDMIVRTRQRFGLYPDKLVAYFADRWPVIFPKIRNRLEVRLQPTRQPNELQIAPTLTFQPSR